MWQIRKQKLEHFNMCNKFWCPLKLKTLSQSTEKGNNQKNREFSPHDNNEL